MIHSFNANSSADKRYPIPDPALLIVKMSQDQQEEQAAPVETQPTEAAPAEEPKAEAAPAAPAEAPAAEAAPEAPAAGKFHSY